MAAQAPVLHDDSGRYSAPRDKKRTKERKRGGKLAGFLFLLLLLVGGAAAVFFQFIHQPLSADAAKLRARVAELERQLHHTEGQVTALRTQNTQLTSEAERLRAEHAALSGTVQQQDAQIQALEAAQREIEQRFGAEIASGDIRIRGGGGNLSIGLADQILFPSGQAELSERGKALLRRVAESLATLQNRLIQVEGHTDSMPLSAGLRERFPTNWELSAARATNVVRFLTEECSVPGERLVASGFSQYHPAASNRSATGRRRNRRIELNLLPLARRN